MPYCMTELNLSIKQSSRSNTIIVGSNDDSGGRQRGAHDAVSAVVLLSAAAVLELEARMSGPLVPLPIVVVVVE